MNPFEGTDGKFLQQLADLQVLDYVCGNVGRHFDHMTYDVDQNGKIISIQGFGNNNAFGHFANGKEARGKLAGCDDLGVISASMADKILSLDPAMLKFTLRGRGLSEEEMDYSVQRLTDLKEAIRKGDEYYSDPKNAPAEQDPSNPYPLKPGYLRRIPDNDSDPAAVDDRSERCGKGYQQHLFGSGKPDESVYGAGKKDRDYFRRYVSRYNPQNAGSTHHWQRLYHG